MSTHDEADLRYLLLPAGKSQQIGAERGRAVSDGIAVYRSRSPQGSARYVMYRSGEPIAALQVMAIETPGIPAQRDRGGQAVVANVYTVPSERRKKHASVLLQRAREDYDNVWHSSSLTDAGAKWARATSSLPSRSDDNPLALRDYSDYCSEIARRYDAMPDFDPSEAWRWDLLIAHVETFFRRISRDVDIRFVDGQPYESAEQMRESVKRTGVMEISTEGIEHPIFTPEQQLKFRAVHDYVVHILPGDRGPSFTERGEIRGYNLHRQLAPPRTWPALFTEVAAQACYVNSRGTFPVQKVAVMPGVDFYNVGELSDFHVKGKRLVANPSEWELAKRWNLSPAAMSVLRGTAHVARQHPSRSWKVGPVAHELLREGYIEDAPGRGGRVSRYKITDKGFAAVEEMDGSCSAVDNPQIRALARRVAAGG